MTGLALTLAALGALTPGAAPAADPLAATLAELRAETRRLGDERAVRAPERRHLLDRLAELRFAALESERRTAELEAQASRVREETATALSERDAAEARLARMHEQAQALATAAGVPDQAETPDAALRTALEAFETARSAGDAPTVVEAEVEAPDGSRRLADELRLGATVLRVARDGSFMAVGAAGPDGRLRWESRTDWLSLRTARQAVAAARRQRPAEIMLLPVGLP